MKLIVYTLCAIVGVILGLTAFTVMFVVALS